MNSSDQQLESDILQGQVASADYAGSCKPKTREVKARYMQNKPAHASKRQVGSNSNGRPESAAYRSAGWVELQLPNHESTPLMMNTAGGSAVLMQHSKPRRPQPTPAPSTAQRSLQQTTISQRRQQQQKAELGSTSSQLHRTPAGAPGLQRLQGDIVPLPDTARRASAAAAPTGALISPGSSRSSTSCSFRQSHHEISEPDSLAVQPLQHAVAMETHTPQVSRLASSMVGGPDSALHPVRLGMSAVVGSALHPARTADKAAAERKFKLEEFLLQKKLQKHQGPKGAAIGKSSQGTSSFKEPAPKTIFKATAEAVTRGASRPPTSARCAAGSSSAAAAAAPTCGAASCASGDMPTPAAAVGGAGPAGSPGSAFKATMATLQQTGSGSKAGRPSCTGKLQVTKASRPSCVPLLPMDWMQQQGGGNTGLPAQACGQQQQQSRRLSTPVSATKIPTINFSAVMPQQQQGGLSVPLSSRHVSSAAHVPLPDATPRAFRDAPPSRLPKTPRGPLHTQEAALANAAADAPGFAVGAASPAVSAGTGSLSSRQRATAVGTHTNGATPRVMGSSSSSKAASSVPSHAAAIATQQGLNSSGGGMAAAERHHHAAAMQRSLKTPRGPVRTAAAAASTPGSPRSLTTSSAAGLGVSAAAVHIKRTENEHAEEMRQRLRLLRMQHLQLRHLTARFEAAVQAKKEKTESVAAAAATAVIDLSGELLAMKGHLVHEQWSSQLAKLVQHQLPKLRTWAQLQVQHSGHKAKLQTACKAALSHVPLLNGAAVGHHPEAPDLELLQRQLVHGMQLLQEVRPALQQLLGSDLTATMSSSSSASSSKHLTAAAGPAQDLNSGGAGHQTSSSSALPQSQLGVLSCSIKSTAALAEQLMDVAADECSLLSQLSQQLAQLSDLHLYATSMQVQLEQMKQAAAGAAQPQGVR